MIAPVGHVSEIVAVTSADRSVQRGQLRSSGASQPIQGRNFKRLVLIGGRRPGTDDQARIGEQALLDQLWRVDAGGRKVSFSRNVREIAVVLLTVFIFVFVNLMIDVLYGLLDPQIRYR